MRQSSTKIDAAGRQKGLTSLSSSPIVPHGVTSVAGPSPRATPPSAIRDNRARSRYELRIDGEPTGWLEYRQTETHVIVGHTVISADHQGQGLGPLLLGRALEDARHVGKTVIATCPFAKGYIARHVELDAYLPPDLRRRR